MKLCCFFNYGPLYRQSIYKAIDDNFDCQFFFGEEVQDGKKSGIKKLDYSVFRKPPIEFKNKKLFNSQVWRTKAAFLPFSKYDTFLITGDFVVSYIPMLLFCKLLGKRVYAWGHGIKSRKGKGRLLNDFLYKNITGFLAYGQKGRERLIELGYNADKIHVIYNSLSSRLAEHSDLSSNIYKDRFGNEDPVLIFIGRLTAEKQLDWLIRVHAELNRSQQPCNLVLVGNGAEMQTLQKLAEGNGFGDRIWFFGECYDDSVNGEMLYNASLCVSPGNVGLTAINSMQYGTPVISHDDFETQGPEYEAIVEDKTGSLYKKGDFGAFLKSIDKWLILTKNHREEIRRNCYEMINGNWNSDNQLKVLKKVLEGDSE